MKNGEIHTWVIYCGLDGFAGAWAAYQKLGADGVEYIAHQEGYELPSVQVPVGCRVCYINMAPAAIRNDFKASVLVIDSHPAAGLLEGDNVEVVHDAAKCAAVLAWEYFHKGMDVPLHLRFVDDYERGVFAMDDTRAAVLGMREVPANFKSWDLMFEKVDAHSMSMDAHRLVMERGRVLLGLQERYVHKMLKQARQCLVGGVDCLAVNSALWQNDVCQGILRELGFGVIAGAYWYAPEFGGMMWRLRSRGDVDVGALAARLGGGGHPRSAWFIERDVVRWVE